MKIKAKSRWNNNTYYFEEWKSIEHCAFVNQQFEDFKEIFDFSEQNKEID